MIEESKAIEVLERILTVSEADAAEASLWGGSSATTRFADNAITQNIYNAQTEVSVSAAFGNRHGSASSNDLSDDALRELVRRAQEIARVSPPDPEYMPPVDAGEARRYVRTKRYFKATAAFDPESRARTICESANRVATRGFRLSGAFQTSAGFSAIANSNGLRGTDYSSFAELHTTVLGENGSGWAEKVENNIRKLEPSALVSEALSIAEAAQDPIDLEPGRYTVILKPAAIAELLGYMICDAKATDEGRTFLREKMGKPVCGENITIRSDPADPRCPGSPFHGDGLACRSLTWIEKGVLRNLATSRYWAKKTGREPTGWPANIILDGGDSSMEAMIAATDRGLLVNRLHYIRFVEPMRCLLTGMTRDGLFLIEGGKIAGPVKNLRFNESVPEVLSRVERMSAPERRGRCLVPAVQVREFNFTSSTKF